MLSQSDKWLEFRPRPSRGRWWTAGMGIAVFLIVAGPFVPALGELHVAVFAIFLMLGLAISLPILVPAWYFPEIRYWLGPDELVLRFGPLMNDRIPLDSIQTVRRKNLRISPLASFRFPGLALFNVHYLDERMVRMCATSASKDILLIETDSRKYGVTPEDESGFLEAMRARVGERGEIPSNLEGDAPTDLETVER